MIIILMILIITVIIIVKTFVSRGVTRVEYNVNYPPYVNMAKINEYVSKHKTVTKVNKLIKWSAKKMGVEYISLDGLLHRSLRYTSSRKFYNDVMIKKRYRIILQKTLGILIVKSDRPLDAGILSVGYLKHDKLDAILFKMLMKLKLAYGLGYSIKEIKKVVDVKCMKYDTFDEFINCDKVRDIMGAAFGFGFINH